MLLDPRNVCSLRNCATMYLVQKLRYHVISYALPVMAAIFDLPLSAMLESVHTDPAVLPDLGNVGVASAISLISFREAELLRYFICNSGNGGHLCFISYPDIGKCPH